MKTNDTNKTTQASESTKDTIQEPIQVTTESTSEQAGDGKHHGCHHKNRRRKKWLIPAMLIGALLVGGLMGRGCAHGTGHGRGGMSMQGHGQMHGDFGDGHKMGMRGQDGVFSSKMIERVGDKVNATDEQKKKLSEIASKFKDGQAERQAAMKAMRQKSLELLSAEPIDTVAIEQIRASQISFMDEQSKRMSQTMVEAAQVLTPEQRTQLAKMAAERGLSKH